MKTPIAFFMFFMLSWSVFAQNKTMDIYQTLSTPKIDGELDDVWLMHTEQVLNRWVSYTSSSENLSIPRTPNDLTVSVRTCWDEQAIYFYCIVIDDIVSTPHNYSDSPYNDGFEFFFDSDNSKNSESTGYDSYDDIIYFNYLKNPANRYSNFLLATIQHHWRNTANGYILECAIPFRNIRTQAIQPGKKIGMEIQYNDCDSERSSDYREHIAKLFEKNDDSYLNPSLLGTVTLQPPKEPPPDVQLSAERIDFGHTPFGQKKHLLWTVTNQGEKSFTLDTLKVCAPFSLSWNETGPWLDILKNKSVDPSATQEIWLQFEPTEPLFFSDVLNVSVHANYNYFPFNIPISGGDFSFGPHIGLLANPILAEYLDIAVNVAGDVDEINLSANNVNLSLNQLATNSWHTSFHAQQSGDVSFNLYLRNALRDTTVTRSLMLYKLSTTSNNTIVSKNKQFEIRFVRLGNQHSTVVPVIDKQFDPSLASNQIRIGLTQSSQAFELRYKTNDPSTVLYAKKQDNWQPLPTAYVNGYVQATCSQTGLFKAERTNKIISQSQLLPNYPNPFNMNTTIRINIDDQDADKMARLDIYNLTGQCVQTILNDHVSTGIHSIAWDGFDSQNRPLTSGLYYAVLVIGDHRFITKMTLLR